MSRRRLLARRPDLLAGLGLLDADRLRLGHQQLDRLARRDLAPHPVEPAAGLKLLEQLLRGRPLPFGRWLERLADLLVGRLDPLGVDDRRQHRLPLERGRGLRLGLVRERLLVAPGDPQVRLLRDALASQHRERVLEQLVRAGMDQPVGHLDLGLGHRRLDHRILVLAFECARVDLLEALADVLAQLRERVEAGGLGREVVVGLGQVLGLDLVDRDRELRLLARQLRSRIVVGERDRDRSLLACARAHQLLLESGHEPARAELHELIAAGASLKFLSVDGAHVVDHRVVAVRGGALHRVERRQPVAQPVDLLVDLGILDLRLAAADLESLVLAELGGRADPDLDRERQRLPLLGHVAHVELGLAYRGDPGAVDRVRVPAPERAPDRLVEDRVAAEPADHHRGRNLALAESGYAHLAAELARGLLDAPLDLLGGDFRLDAHARLGQLGDAGLDAVGHGGRARR